MVQLPFVELRVAARMSSLDIHTKVQVLAKLKFP